MLALRPFEELLYGIIDLGTDLGRDNPALPSRRVSLGSSSLWRIGGRRQGATVQGTVPTVRRAA